MVETTDLQRLVVSMEANIKGLEKTLARASGQVDKSARTIETRFNRMNQGLGESFRRTAGSLGLAFGSAVLIRQAQQLVDSSTRIQNALKIAGLEGDALNQVYQRLFESAQRNAAPIETLTQLYSRASLVQKELGVSTEELLNFTDKVAVALRVSGTSAQEARGALLQLSQALGSGVVRAEEFNSILEGALPIAQAAAAGLKEAGGSVAALRKLVVDGKVSSQAFFRAFEAGASVLDSKVATAQLTVSQGLIQIQNELINAAGEFDKTTGASRTAGQVLNELAGAIKFVAGAFTAAAAPLKSAADLFDKISEAVAKAGRVVGAVTGIDIVGRTLQGSKSAADLINEGALGAGLTSLPKPQVSLADFAPPGGKGGAAQKNAFERTNAQIEKRIALLDAEALTVGRGTLAIEKAEAKTRLLTAAKEAQIKVTPELEAKIEALSQRYGEAAVRVEEARNKIEAINEASKEFGDAFKDAFKDAIFEGKKLDEIMQSLLKRFASKGIDSIFSAIFSPQTGGSTSLFGNLLSSVFGGFRASGGPVSPGKVYAVNENTPNTELFIPKTPGMIVPQHALRGAGGNMQVSVSVSLAGANGDNAIRKIAREEAAAGTMYALSQIPGVSVRSVGAVRQHQPGFLRGG